MFLILGLLVALSLLSSPVLAQAAPAAGGATVAAQATPAPPAATEPARAEPSPVPTPSQLERLQPIIAPLLCVAGVFAVMVVLVLWLVSLRDAAGGRME